jgi:predicted nucleotidyltransferase
MSHQANITRIRAVSNALGELRNKVVFVGGATVSLYADRYAPEVRPTDDVDILVEIATRWDFAKIEEQLRKAGFRNDTTGKFVGRYLLEGFVVDVMPIDEKILGFSNKWYSDGYQSAIDYDIDGQNPIKIFTAPYFIATKLEAFHSRGRQDGRTSQDFEDIVFVLENRRTIWQEMRAADEKLRSYLIAEFLQLRANRHLWEWIDAHSNSYSPPASYFILSDMDAFIR